MQSRLTRRQRRQRQCSSERAARRSATLAMGIRERRPDAAPDVPGAAQARESNTRHHKTCGTVYQCRHVSIEKCPLTTRHAATRSGNSCGSERPSTLRKSSMSQLRCNTVQKMVEVRRSHCPDRLVDVLW